MPSLEACVIQSECGAGPARKGYEQAREQFAGDSELFEWSETTQRMACTRRQVERKEECDW
jgi:hypothetical protein